MRKRTISRSACYLAMLLASSSVFAVEGMWQPEQLPEIRKDLKEKGLSLDPDSLTDLMSAPMNAIVSLGGCSASFVSPKGLVVTNHHCAYGSIQFNSTPEKNLLKDGFVAANMSEELPAAPGSRIFVTVEIQDVTDRLVDGLAGLETGIEKYETLEQRRKDLVSECEKDDGHRCRIDSFFGGASYRLTKQMEIKDVRLVYAPASSIGKYGGDIDNWMWPRHTGDFSFYRAYVSKDGKPAEYSKDNVAYTPKHYLRSEPKGVEAGDFVMVLGYPGRTNRHRLANEVHYNFNTSYPEIKTYMDERIALIEGFAAKDKSVSITYAGRLAGLNNYSKNIVGQLSGYEASGLLERKLKEETAFFNAALSSKNSQVLANFEALQALVDQQQEYAASSFADRLLTDNQLYATARWLYRYSLEKKKPDEKREAGYQERDLSFAKQRLQALSKRFDKTVEIAYWKLGLEQARAYQNDDKPEAYRKLLALSDEQLGKTLSSYMDETSLADENKRLAWLDATQEELEASKDPLIRLAVETHAYHMEKENISKELEGELIATRSAYMKDLIDFNAKKGLATYSDANSTLRITYGNVQGYTNREGKKQEPFTRLEEIAKKHTGKDPFDVPKKQLDLIKKKAYASYASKSLGTVPVNFLADLDITGGNSGSAALNHKGELIGLIFDGTIDGVISDWGFDPAFTRAIQVDIRYMFWVMDELDNAEHLMKEMGVRASQS